MFLGNRDFELETFPWLRGSIIDSCGDRERRLPGLELVRVSGLVLKRGWDEIASRAYGQGATMEGPRGNAERAPRGNARRLPAVGVCHPGRLVCRRPGALKYPMPRVMGTRCLAERGKYFIAINVTLALEGFGSETTSRPCFSLPSPRG